jgi:hypothetical protein
LSSGADGGENAKHVESNGKIETQITGIVIQKRTTTKTEKWSAQVTMVSTFLPKDLYTNDSATIARVMATEKVSPRGRGSAIRMVRFLHQLSRQKYFGRWSTRA